MTDILNSKMYDMLNIVINKISNYFNLPKNDKDNLKIVLINYISTDKQIKKNLNPLYVEIALCYLYYITYDELELNKLIPFKNNDKAK